MKISRIKSVSAAEEVKFNSKYTDAISHIRMAIDALGENAKDDGLAKDSIANLSVVLLDLQESESEVSSEEQ